MTRMYAHLTVAGTAMAETALCFKCLDESAAPIERSVTRARAMADWDGVEWLEECTENDALECSECGARAAGGS